MDVMMESISSGLEAAKSLKDAGLLEGVKLIFLTSVDDHYHDQELIQADRLPSSIWLSKPVKPRELLMTIRKLME
jgi:CheY-like chemotaxis protein